VKKSIPPVTDPQGNDSEMLEKLQRETFDYFIKQVDPTTGLIADKTAPDSPSSIAAVGLGITAFIAGVERGFVSREEASRRILKVLRFLAASVQSKNADATGYRGFFYHFLDMKTGARAWHSELSTIDTAIFIAGALTAAEYFSGSHEAEKEIRSLADSLYHRIDWKWALDGGTTLTHGWNPETGFLPYRWDRDYSEALILYILALGSPTFPIEPESYHQWTSTFQWKKIYDTECIFAGPLFIHQMSHLWINFKGIQDDVNRKYGIDYFENSRRATLLQREYAIKNPLGFEHYGEFCWGMTASDGPGPLATEVDGKERVFYDYVARGAPNDIDDGTISPWGVVASLPFAPEVVIGTIRHAIERLNLKNKRLYGFDASFNPTYPVSERNPHGWVSKWRFGLNQGPIVIMIENFASGIIWKCAARSPAIKNGLKRAGFRASAPL
jgi:hypothetical protein